MGTQKTLNFGYIRTKKKTRNYYALRKHTDKKSDPLDRLERPDWLSNPQGELKIRYD